MNRFLHIYSLVIPFVVGTQAALGDTVPGETKKQFVIEMLKGAAKIGENFPDPVVAQISALIDLAASVYLGKSAAPAVAVAKAA